MPCLHLELSLLCCACCAVCTLCIHAVLLMMSIPLLTSLSWGAPSLCLGGALPCVNFSQSVLSFQTQQNSRYCCGMQDAARFLLLSLTVNMIIYISFLPIIVKFQLGSSVALLQLLGTVLNALPPLLATLLVTLRAVTVMRLRRQSVFVSDTQKLQTAAQLDLVLFDKTGTLTVGEVRARDWLCIHFHNHNEPAPCPLCIHFADRQ